ncbi:MAG TPA: Hsp20/alpha crystallin family protein [Campylobacterales bacterium]|nr:Hsp20/alpha crystallin family protein [Campylobacterales bacterium]HHS93314.1 Hsp20/alpha crystallin family protein [Campylobacterales bacterium]
MSVTKDKIVETTKELANSVEEGIEKGIEVAKEALGNVARHLPLANFAKHTSDTYDIEIDLPGVDKNDIELKIEDDYLTVNALRKTKDEVKEDDYYLCESNFGLISRSFVLPKDVDREKISAHYEDGRLYISLEKEEARKARSISIN